MPRPQNPFLVLLYQPMDSPQLDAIETHASLQSNRIEPILGNTPVAFDMNMRRLFPVTCEEEEPIRTDAEHRRHAEL